MNGLFREKRQFHRFFVGVDEFAQFFGRGFSLFGGGPDQSAGDPEKLRIKRGAPFEHGIGFDQLGSNLLRLGDVIVGFEGLGKLRFFGGGIPQALFLGFFASNEFRVHKAGLATQSGFATILNAEKGFLCLTGVFFASGTESR